MNILVFGGSYFLGKHFVHMASREHSITVFNRGSRPLGLADVKEIKGDRHDIEAIEGLKDNQYDVIVDFCAYEKNDIKSVFDALNGLFKQYIFVSTCDVYEHGLGSVLDENAPMERRSIGGQAGDYISGKVILEEELVRSAKEYDVAYTSIRPAIIYGPDNYAPRESMYFYWINNTGQILHPEDATGEFQMVYVEDVARAIFKAMGNETSYNQAYNLTPMPIITYESFADALKKAVLVPFERIPVTLNTIYEKQIPLPFPLTKAESNWYNGEKALQLIGRYTDLADGLKKTYI